MKTFNSIRKLDEKTLTPAELKKREEVAKALKREHPNMPMGMKMAIATKTAKRVAEDSAENSGEWKPTGKKAKHIGTGEDTYEYAKVDKEGKQTGERHYRNVQGKVMGEETKYYSLVHKATNKVLSTHKDLESAKDEHRGMDQGERAHYRIATSTKEPKTWNMKEELDELNQMTLARYQSKAKSVGMQGGAKSAKHLAGAKRAGEKLKYGDYSEEVEQVDELKQATVKSYMNKSITDFGHQNFMSRVGKGTDKETATRKAKNRSLGIERANKKLKEDVEQLDEMDSKERFKDYHNETAKLMKGIHSALSQHYNLHNKTAHWGHVGDIRHIHDQLRDIHDRLHEQGEYAKKAKEHSDKMNVAMRGEEVELSEGYTEGDIANGGTVIYKHQGKHYMSKVSHKTGGGAGTKIHTTSSLGHVVPLHNIVSTDASDWNTYKNRPVKEEVDLDEAGPFSYGIKLPRKGSVAYNAMMKRKEQEKDKMPIEPKDHMVGIAKVVKEEIEEQHLCAKHVYSNVYGEGIVLEGQHAEPDENGNIEWYVVDFKVGPKKVFTEKLEIMVAEYHNNHKKKRMTDGR